MMKHFSLFLLLIFFAICSPQANALIIHVPGDSATIQGAVNGVEHGDTVLVAPGTYNENVNWYCKAILLASHYLFDHDTLTIDSTIIDGGGGDALYVWGGDCFPEDESLTVIGFTVRNSAFGMWKEVTDWPQHELRIISRIRYCKFIDNTWGIHTRTDDDCVIDRNIFINNAFGVACWGGMTKHEKNPWAPFCTTVVENNVFLFNRENGACSFGGAVQIFRNNIFSRNKLGIGLGYSSTLNAVRNVISNNSIGVYCELYDQGARATIENNIIAANDTGIYIWGLFPEHAQIRYNDVWDNLAGNFVDCSEGVGDTTWGTNFNGTPCDSFYNIVRDPLFADTIDFRLLCNSPCIDAGDSSVQVPDSGGCRMDIGKNEFHYIIGDATSDYVISISDVIFIINYLFLESPAPCPYHSADTNCDGIVDVTDVICLTNYLFYEYPFPCF
jgi:hypothetical protein